MKLSSFIKHLEEVDQKDITFEFNGNEIQRDYHLTEVMKAGVEAINCGGKIESWNETVLQLVEPSVENTDRTMPVSKFMGILNRSMGSIDFDTNSKVILEFQHKGKKSLQRYSITDMILEETKLVVETSGEYTQCKALKDKKSSFESPKIKEVNCCAPHVTSCC